MGFTGFQSDVILGKKHSEQVANITKGGKKEYLKYFLNCTNCNG